MIIISCSGGIDSTFTIFLIKKLGYKNIICIYIKIWSFNCKFKKDIKLIKNLSKIFKFKTIAYNCEEKYKKKVLKPFLKKYKNGKTPNGDIFCNSIIKFKILYHFIKTRIKKKTKNKIITGHYAKIKNKSIETPIDIKKDQSFFLYKIKKKTIKKTYFPIGFFFKKQIVKILDITNINIKKKSSRGICFIERKKFSKFIKKKIGNKIYKVVNYNKKILGNCSAYKTIGQKVIIKKERFYIYKKERYKKISYVDDKKKNQQLFLSNKIIIKKQKKKVKSKIFFCKIRSDSKLEKCTIYKIKKKTFVVFAKLQNFSIGQSIVFYKKKKIIFGGIINKIFHKNFINF